MKKENDQTFIKMTFGNIRDIKHTNALENFENNIICIFPTSSNRGIKFSTTLEAIDHKDEIYYTTSFDSIKEVSIDECLKCYQQRIHFIEANDMITLLQSIISQRKNTVIKIRIPKYRYTDEHNNSFIKKMKEGNK